MQAKINDYRRHWRDVLVVLTAMLVLGSLVLISYSIAQANRIAASNKSHIDCIIKDLATPQKPGTSHKFISDLSSQCNIRFTQ